MPVWFWMVLYPVIFGEAVALGWLGWQGFRQEQREDFDDGDN